MPPASKTKADTELPNKNIVDKEETPRSKENDSSLKEEEKVDRTEASTPPPGQLELRSSKILNLI